MSFHVSFLPVSDKLAPYIQAYYIVRFDTIKDARRFKFFPIGNPHIVFYCNGKLTTYIKGATFFSGEPTLHGHILQFFEFDATPETEFAGIGFTPTGMYKLLGVNAREVSNCVKPLRDFICDQAYIDRISQVQCDEDVANANDDFFLGKLRTVYPLPAVIDQCVADIHALQGNISVDTLSRKYNCSRRYLEKHFSYGLGVSPGNFAKRIRFFDVMKKIEAENVDRERQLTEFSYYDKSHFMKDFKFFMGENPRSYFSKTPLFNILIKENYLIINRLDDK